MADFLFNLKSATGLLLQVPKFLGFGVAVEFLMSFFRG